MINEEVVLSVLLAHHDEAASLFAWDIKTDTLVELEVKTIRARWLDVLGIFIKDDSDV